MSDNDRPKRKITLGATQTSSKALDRVCTLLGVTQNELLRGTPVKEPISERLKFVLREVDNPAMRERLEDLIATLKKGGA